MNAKQMQYAVLLSESESFSQLAEKLNITQPALSKQILALEKELDVQLFKRNASPLTLTPAGEHFVHQAKLLLYQQDQLERSMEQFRTGEVGQLVIGATPFRCTYLLPDILRKVREAFPGVQVKVVETGSDTLRKEVADGKFDFAVVNLPVDEDLLDATPIEPDRLVLVIEDGLLQQYPNLQNLDATDLRGCEDLPFVVVGPGQEMRQLFHKLCQRSHISPNIAAEVVSLTTAWEMACAGIGATLLPLQFVCRNGSHPNIHTISLRSKVSMRQPAVVVKKGQYLSPCAKYAISLLTE